VTRKQRLILVFLAVADCVVLGGLAGVVALTPRRPANPPAAAPSPTVYPTETPTAALQPTFTPTPPPSPTGSATRPPRSTPPPTRTPLIIPTVTPTPSPTPEPVALQNADFEDIAPSSVAGWEVAAVVNWQPGEDFDPGSSYGAPLFKYADDPLRVINGSTLQIESAGRYVRFKVTLYQTVAVEPGSRVTFEIKSRGYSDEGGIQVQAGIDPNGGPACANGRWSESQAVDQNSDVVTLRSPAGVVGEDGQATVCFFAEPQYAVASKAAFFDDATLVVEPPKPETP